MQGPTLIRCFLCWLFGHKWGGKRFYAADGSFEICSRCGLRGKTVYYKHNPNPVRFEDDAWYWWDETWTGRTGPFDTREEADVDCMRYCIECLGE